MEGAHQAEPSDSQLREGLQESVLEGRNTVGFSRGQLPQDMGNDKGPQEKRSCLFTLRILGET